MANAIEGFLNSKNIKFKQVSDNYQIDCFMCSDTKSRLGVSTKTGSWHCFNCDRSGKKIKSLEYAWNNKGDISTSSDNEEKKKSSIKKDLHEIFYKKIKLTNKYESFRYVTDHRGLSKSVIKHFKLGSRSKFKKASGSSYDAGEHLAIPYLVDGKCVNIKYRDLNPESDMKWRREKGGVSSLFNQDVIKNLDYNWIIITESEIDTMSIWDIGFKNTVGLTVGAKGFKQDWYDKLKRFNRIFLLLDNDEAGREGSEKLARRLGLGRCYKVELPDGIKDPNEYIQKYDKNNFKKLLAASSKYQVRGRKGLRDMMRKSIQQKFYAEEEGLKDFFDTPWKMVNAVLGPLRPGHLFILCGKPKCFHHSTIINTDNGKITIKNAVESKSKSTLAYNTQTNRVHKKRISDWIYSGNLECLKITTASGKFLKVTLDHEIFVNGLWVEAKNIVLGDLLVVLDRKNNCYIEGLHTKLEEVILIENIGMHDCYDLTVPDYHNLFANDIVAHNSGKSTVSMNLMEYWGRNKINTGMYSCEMNDVSIADKFTMMKTRTIDKIEDITQSQVHQAMAKLPMDRMNFYFPERKELKGDLDSIEGVMRKIEEMVQRYGIKIFVFDNLHFLCRGENEKTLLDTATQQFKLLAEELDIVIVLVAHPRKTNSNKQLTTDDMKGSSSLFQDADVVWLMFRKALDGNITPDEVDGKTEGSMSVRADISITGRWTTGGNTFLAFDGKHSTFKDKGKQFMKLVEEIKKGNKRKGRGL